MKLNQNLVRVRKWVLFENACPKFGVFSPLKIGGPKPYILTFFRWFHDLTVNLTADINGMKHNIDNQEPRCKSHWVFCTASIFHELCHMPKNRTGVSTHPPSILHSVSWQGFAHESQRTELNQTLTNGSKNGAKMCDRPPQKLGIKSCLLSLVFRRLRDLMAKRNML